MAYRRRPFKNPLMTRPYGLKPAINDPGPGELTANGISMGRFTDSKIVLKPRSLGTSRITEEEWAKIIGKRDEEK